MVSLWKLVSRWRKADQGAQAVEYGLILALMVIAIVAAISATGQASNANWQSAADAFPEETS